MDIYVVFFYVLHLCSTYVRYVVNTKPDNGCLAIVEI